MKLYITKWVLTSGIIEVDTEMENITENINQDGIIFYYGRYCKSAIPSIFYPQKDIHTTYEDARIVANITKLKKILSLQKQIKKLELKTF